MDKYIIICNMCVCVHILVKIHIILLYVLEWYMWGSNIHARAMFGWYECVPNYPLLILFTHAHTHTHTHTHILITFFTQYNKYKINHYLHPTTQHTIQSYITTIISTHIIYIRRYKIKSRGLYRPEHSRDTNPRAFWSFFLFYRRLLFVCSSVRLSCLLFGRVVCDFECPLVLSCVHFWLFGCVVYDFECPVVTTCVLFGRVVSDL